jgi:hypothetical protein
MPKRKEDKDEVEVSPAEVTRSTIHTGEDGEEEVEA